MKEIGGYFELELPAGNIKFLHSDGILLNSGRNALKYILKSVGTVGKIWIPDYTCNSIRKTVEDLDITYDIYPVDQKLEPAYLPSLSDNEYIVINNYFGIKDEFVKKMIDLYQDQVIIDNTQAWFNNSTASLSFYSPRKYFGVPDGGIAYVNKNCFSPVDRDCSYARMEHLLKRLDGFTGEGYKDFKRLSSGFTDMPVKQMSNLTRRLLESIDYSMTKRIRCRNFEILHSALQNSNMLELPQPGSYECSMAYPYLVNSAGLREYLIGNNIFVPVYWHDVLNNHESGYMARFLSESLLALPIDQRYGEEEMNYIIKTIERWMCR